jgi:hypothetical protein
LLFSVGLLPTDALLFGEPLEVHRYCTLLILYLIGYSVNHKVAAVRVL